MAERTIYGESATNADALNLRGKVYQHFDGAGVVTNVAFDFKGNLLQSSRQLASEYKLAIDWSDINAVALESEIFVSETSYDALNRPTSSISPDQSEMRPTYNEAGLLEKVEARIRSAASWTTFVDDIDYDAKGQRERIVYGNGTTTTYTYDPLTFRLTRLKTTRTSDGAVLQNLTYTYDPVGNIVAIYDSAQQSVFFNNDVVTPSAEYEYDAIYRLISASGREHAGGMADDIRGSDELPLNNLPHANDAQALRNYTQHFKYDAVGNILAMIHEVGATPLWIRKYAYATDSNRLLATRMPGDPLEGPYTGTYDHDVHGNMTRMPHLPGITWDENDQMHEVDLGGGGTAYYVYDAAGQRVRKIWEHSGLVEERIYLGLYEIYRKRDVTGLVLERETLHLMDDARRIALVETKTVDTSVPAFQPVTRVRYQLGNHLGSACLEVDEAGLVISYEEYHPYGTTAYWSARSGVEVSVKRYRYTGKERDEETGLYYHGARYYAPWLGRWTAADPAGMVDGANLYCYVCCKPVNLVDPSGQQGATVEDAMSANAYKYSTASEFAESSDAAGFRSREAAQEFWERAQTELMAASKHMPTAQPLERTDVEEATNPDPAYRYTGQPRLPDPSESNMSVQTEATAGGKDETHWEYTSYVDTRTEDSVIEGTLLALNVASTFAPLFSGAKLESSTTKMVKAEGQAAKPRVTFHPNSDGATRTLPEALGIAERAGVNVDSESFAFRLDHNLPKHVGAEYGKIRRVQSGDIVEMDSFLYRFPDGRIKINVNPNILSSDEAIIGTLGHETYEAVAVEAEFLSQGRRLRADVLRGLVDPEYGTLHSEAWDIGDEFVRNFRKALGE